MLMGALWIATAAASSRTWPAAVLLLYFISIHAAAQTAVGPSASVKPLYACSMQISDLPQFSGAPTPEMLAGNLGLAMGLQGLLSDFPDKSCKELSNYGGYGGSYDSGHDSYGRNSYSDGEYVRDTAGLVSQQDPSTSRHGRRQQRPQRENLSSWAQQQVAAAGNSPAGFVHGLSAGSDSGAAPGRGGVDGPAARAYKYRIASLGAAAAAAANLTVSTAAVGVASMGPASGNATQGNAITTATNSSSSSNSSAPSPAVWSHNPSSRAASRRQQQHHQQQQQQQQQLAEAKVSRHLLADGGALEVAASWSDDLFGGEAEDDFDTQADAFVEKQYCNKGTWMASLSSAQYGMTPASLGSSSSSSANALTAGVSTAAAGGNGTVGISGLRNLRVRKGHKGKGNTAHEVDTVPGVPGAGLDDAGSYDSYSMPQPPPKPRRRTGFKPVWGEDGLWMSESGVVPADSTVAAGPRHVMHIVNSLVKIMTVDPMHGVPTGTDGYGYEASPDAVIVTLPDFFGLVASSCDGGYITPSAAYDKQAQRFIVTAVCGGDANQILLAVSQSDDATGGWWLYTFPGYVTYDTHMACTDGHNHFNPTSIHSKVSYNKDGVYVSFVQNCPLCEVPQATGSVLFALPKWALYCGNTNAVIGPVYNGMDVSHAVGQQDQDLCAWSFRQLQPVQPQRPVDVQADIAYFVNDPISTSKPLHRTRLTTAALLNTGSLWQYTCEEDPAPVLVARVTGRGVDCGIDKDTKLQQPQGQLMAEAMHKGHGQCAGLNAGATRPQGFWSGGAALYGNQIYLTDRGPDLRPKGCKPDTPLQPTVYWAVLSPSLCATGTCAAFMGQNWGYDHGWDWGTCSWHEHPKSQHHAFFDLKPPKLPQKAESASTAPVAPTDPLLQFLTNVAEKAASGLSSGLSAGRHLLQADAQGQQQQHNQQGADAVSVAAAVDTALWGKGHQMKTNVQDKQAAQDKSKQSDAHGDASAGPSPTKAGSGSGTGSSSSSSSNGGGSSSSSSSSSSGAAEKQETPGVSSSSSSTAPGVRTATAKAGASARRSPFLPPAAAEQKKKRAVYEESFDGLYDISYEDDDASDADSAVESYSSTDSYESTSDDDDEGSVQANRPAGKKAGARIRSGDGSSGKKAAPNAARTKGGSGSSSKAAPYKQKPATQRAQPKPSVMDVADGGEDGTLVLSVDELDKLAGLSDEPTADADVEGAPKQQQQQPQKPKAQTKPPKAAAPNPTPLLADGGAAAKQQPKQNPAPGDAKPKDKATAPRDEPKPFTMPKVDLQLPVPRAADRTPKAGPGSAANQNTVGVRGEQPMQPQHSNQHRQQQQQQQYKEEGFSYLGIVQDPRFNNGPGYLPIGAEQQFNPQGQNTNGQQPNRSAGRPVARNSRPSVEEVQTQPGPNAAGQQDPFAGPGKQPGQPGQRTQSGPGMNAFPGPGNQQPGQRPQSGPGTQPGPGSAQTGPGIKAFPDPAGAQPGANIIPPTGPRVDQGLTNQGANWPAPEPTVTWTPKRFVRPGMDDLGQGNNGLYIRKGYGHPREYLTQSDIDMSLATDQESYVQNANRPAPPQQQPHHHKKQHRIKHSKKAMKKIEDSTTVWDLMLHAADRDPATPQTHEAYYDLWRDFSAVRRVYCKLGLEPCYNPCKFIRDWYRDTKITFGVLVSRRGVIDMVTSNKENPLGLAFPQVVVREGSALVVYSYSGPKLVPGENCPAFPGVGYSVIPPGQAMGSPAFNLLHQGDSCVTQGPSPSEQSAWGSYSGADIHFLSGVAYTAVQYSTRPGGYHTQPSNAGTWLQAFAPAKAGWKKHHHQHHNKTPYVREYPYYPPSDYAPAYPPAYPPYGRDAGYGGGDYGGSSSSGGSSGYSSGGSSGGYSSGGSSGGYSSGGSSSGYSSSGSSSGYSSGGSSSGYSSGGSSGGYSSGGSSSGYSSSGSSGGYSSGGSSSGYSSGGSSGGYSSGGSSSGYSSGGNSSGYSSSGSSGGYSSGGSSSGYSSGGSSSGYSSSGSSGGYSSGGSSSGYSSSGSSSGYSSGGSSSGYSSSGSSGSSSGYSSGGSSSGYSSSGSSSGYSSGGSSGGYSSSSGGGYNTPGYDDSSQYPDGGWDDSYDYPGDGSYGDSNSNYGSSGSFATKPQPQPPGWMPPNGSPLPEDGPKYLPIDNVSWGGTPGYDDMSYDGNPSYGNGGDYGSGYDQYVDSPFHSSSGSSAGGYSGSSSGGYSSSSSGGGGGYYPPPSPGYGGQGGYKGKGDPLEMLLQPAQPGKGSDQQQALLVQPALPGKGQQNIHGGFVLTPGGQANGNNQQQAGADILVGAARVDAAGPAVQQAAKLQQQLIKAQMLEQQHDLQHEQEQQTQLLRLQNAQLAKQQQLLQGQLQAAKQQQQQQQQQAVSAQLGAQKGAVLPATGLEAASTDLAQGLAVFGTKALQALSKRAQQGTKTAAAAPMEPARADSAVQYFDDYEPVEQQQQQLLPSATSANLLQQYLQGLAAQANRHAITVGIASVQPADVATVDMDVSMADNSTTAG